MIPVEERERIRDERNAHRRRRLNDGGYQQDDRSTISEITRDDNTRANDQRNVAELQTHADNNNAQSSGGTIMGGRNEQASQNGRGPP